MNDDRAEWANECIALMSEITGCDPDMEALGDLFSDIFHWADRKGITHGEIHARFAGSYAMYQQETMADPETCAKCGITISGDPVPDGSYFYCSVDCRERH